MSDEEICDVDRTVCDARMRRAVAVELRSVADKFNASMCAWAFQNDRPAVKMWADQLYASLHKRANELDPSGATPGGEPT